MTCRFSSTNRPDPPSTPRGALMRDSGLTPAPVVFDSRQQRFAARLANACEGTKLKELHDYPTSGAPIWRVVSQSMSVANGSDHALTSSRRRTGGRGLYTGRGHSKESCEAIQEGERSQSRCTCLNVVDGQIGNGRPKSGSRSSKQTQRQLGASLQVYRQSSTLTHFRTFFNGMVGASLEM